MRYLPLEKLVLALVHAMRTLPHYFQAHIVYVLTEYSLQSLLKRSDFIGRIVKWGTRLGSFDIRYGPRSLVKGQVLIDFIAEFSPRVGKEMVCLVEVIPWKLFVDGASNALGAGVGIVVITPEGIKLEHSFRLGFMASNNEDLGAKEVEIYSNSRLVVNQVQGSFEAKDPQMMEYLWLAKQTMDRFHNVKVVQVARGQNRHADSLAILASSSTEEIPRLIKVELVAKSSINAGVSVSIVTTVRPCWMDPIIDFLAEDRVPADEKEAKKWGLDIVGQFPRATGNRKFVLVVVDYFIKWVEVEALANIRDVDVKKFVWRNLVTRFGVPESLVSNNRSTIETLFFLTYGAEVVIPAEINLCSARVSGFNLTENLESMLKQLNLLEQHQESATIWLAEYQQKFSWRYNRDVRKREFRATDIVLRKVVGNTGDINAGKLAPT
ncbi:uncharacterized protein LOC142619188 [Castanea sativa]|uniref:uncharacterized protein LOC142619188 n=1 Tax=Castanea sativa TaxID=21020 RepID=UPI003F649915